MFAALPDAQNYSAVADGLKDSCVEAFTKGKTPRTNSVPILEGRTALITGICLAVLLTLLLFGATAAHMQQAVKGVPGVVEAGDDTETSPGPELQHLNPSSGQNSVSYDTFSGVGVGSSKVNAAGMKGSHGQDTFGAGSNQTAPQGATPGREPWHDEMSRRHSV